MHRLGDGALPAGRDASSAARADQVVLAGCKRKGDFDDASQDAMRAELDALQQRNNSLMRKLTRVMHDSRLMQEENLATRHIIAAVAGSPSHGRADAAFIHSRDAEQQQQLQRQLSRRPSSTLGMAAAANPAAAASACLPVAQQGMHLRNHAALESPGSAPPMDLPQAVAACLLPVPLQMVYPTAKQQKDSLQQDHQALSQQHAWPATQIEQWQCGFVQPEEPYYARIVPTAASGRMLTPASAATITAQLASKGHEAPPALPTVAVQVQADSAVVVRQVFQQPASPEPALPMLEKAAAVLRSSEQAGLLQGAELTNITTALVTEARAARCSSKGSDHSGSANGSVDEAAGAVVAEPDSSSGQLASQSSDNQAAAAATTAAAGQISHELLEKVAARALAKAKGEASSALLQLVAAGVGVPVDALADSTIP